MEIYQKAVFYQIVHSLGMLVIPLFAKVGMLTEPESARACGLLLTGIMLFSGSLYALAFTGVKTLGAITPLGGVTFIAAWGVLAYGLFRH
jgi:uncharacterized membrane protein YgdD (TMEM256/DUF423 family)